MIRRPIRDGACVPRSDDLDDFHEIRGGTVIHGEIASMLYPDDVTIQTDDDVVAWRREIADKMRRRRPCGFAPWPEPPGELRRVA